LTEVSVRDKSQNNQDTVSMESSVMESQNPSRAEDEDEIQPKDITLKSLLIDKNPS
jgi:hypothetical protein